MWDFLKNVFSKQGGDITVVVLDDDEPDQSRSFKFRSSELVWIALVVVSLSIVFTTLLFFVTPLGSLYQYRQDERLRNEVISVSEKLFALSDSLEARDRQLVDLKRILVETPDTVFQSDFIRQEASIGNEPGYMVLTGDIQAYDMLSSDEILYADVFSSAPAFPAAYPIEGSLSQEFEPGENHFGIDLAAPEQTEFKAIADGTVIHAGWTVPYGYIIYIQHGDGFISVYKHGAELFKKTGDIVLREDLLGTIGNKGALSFGSHLHFEIWKNGVAQNPRMYLTK